MPELRRNLLTGDWIVVAADRSRRVHDVPAPPRPRLARPYLASCPFCPGNELASAEPVLVVPGEDGWCLRVVPNKFPALETGAPDAPAPDELFPRRAGFGHHEVLVESRRHDDALHRMSPDAVERVFAAFRARYRVLREDPRVAHVVIFKNHGVEAGCSLEHPHSQIVATPVVPPKIASRLDAARRHHERTGACAACRMLAAEEAAGERLVCTTGDFVAFVPFAAPTPFHTWIVPREHRSSFGDISDHQLTGLARCVGTVLGQIALALGDPDYNLIIRSMPDSAGVQAYWHWYVTIVPRVTRQAGFELGSGMFINTALPEDSARLLRQSARRAQGG